MTITHVYADILKAERNEDGDLVVYGKATGPDLDLDKQVCDPRWLADAMPEWFATGGNIREQHTSIAAGVATDLEQDGDSWMVRSVVVDPVSAKKVEKGVLRGYSIGIKDPKVVKDASAPGGRIVGGTIVEVSLVDRPCNPTCTLTLAKAASPGLQVDPAHFDETRGLVRVEELHEEPEGKTADAELAKREFSAEEREQAADRGQALPDGSFPIKNVQDLRNAIRAIGRAKDPAKAKAHIKRRARALGREDLIPEGWKAADADTTKAEGEIHDPAELAQIRDGLVALLKAELDELVAGEDELCDVHELLCALRMLLCWWEGEAAAGETAPPFEREQPEPLTEVMLDAVPDQTKTPAPVVAKAAAGDDDRLAELVKAAVAEATQASEGRIQALEAELAKVKALPAPGGPVLTRTAQDTAKAARRDELLIKANRYRALASQVTDPVTRTGYLELAEQCEREAK